MVVDAANENEDYGEENQEQTGEEASPGTRSHAEVAFEVQQDDSEPSETSSNAYLIAGQRAINRCLADYSLKEEEQYKEERKKLKAKGKEISLNQRVAPPVSCFDRKFSLNETVQTFLSNMQVACAAVSPQVNGSKKRSNILNRRNTQYDKGK